MRKPQAGSVEDVAARAVEVQRAVEGLFETASTVRGRLKRAAVPAARLVLGRLADAIHELAGVVEQGDRLVGDQLARHGAQLDELRIRVKDLERIARVRRESSGEAREPGDVLDADSYTAFEERFRGSREAILERQHDALPYAAELVGSDLPLLDLGCGRGEWLEVLRDAGIPAMGVDSNPSMIEHGRAKGLDVRLGDLLDYIGGCDPGSLGGVSGFHVAEHLPLPVLQDLLRRAHRALAPGGVLVMETPNPMNVVVGASSFYLDPTHLRPVHPFFFKFLAERLGFTDVAVHWVHPADQSALLDAATLVEQSVEARTARVLEAASQAIFGAQDYLLVAHRSAD